MPRTLDHAHAQHRQQHAAHRQHHKRTVAYVQYAQHAIVEIVFAQPKQRHAAIALAQRRAKQAYEHKHAPHHAQPLGIASTEQIGKGAYQIGPAYQPQDARMLAEHAALLVAERDNEKHQHAYANASQRNKQPSLHIGLWFGIMVPHAHDAHCHQQPVNANRI